MTESSAVPRVPGAEVSEPLPVPRVPGAESIMSSPVPRVPRFDFASPKGTGSCTVFERLRLVRFQAVRRGKQHL